jgi:hypothetical protein
MPEELTEKRRSPISVDLMGYKAAWLAWCRRQSTTPSQAFRDIVRRLTAAEQSEPPKLRVTGPPERSAKRLSARLTASELVAVERLAAAESMKPARWLVALIRSYLTREPELGQAELAALSQSNAALRALGRNLNQVARALNTSPHERVLFKVELIEELDRTVKSHAETVSKLLAANIERWRIH